MNTVINSPATFYQVLEQQENKQSFFSSRLRFTPTGPGLPLS